MQQHAADLVAAQKVPFSLSVLDRDAQPVAVRIRCEDDAGADLRRLFEGQVVGSRIFRIRHLDRAEVRIRHFLFFDDSQVGQADFFQHPPDRNVSAAVQGRVNDIQLRSFGLQQFRIDAQGFDLCDIVVINFLVADVFQESLVQGFLFIHQRAVGVFCGPDNPGNACRCLRPHLGPVLSVYFISVVLGRIVACGNHNAGGRVQVPDRVGQNRYRTQCVKQECGNAFLAQHQCGILREFSAAAAAVVCDHNAAFSVFRVFQQVSGQSLGGPADIVLIHPVHSGTQHAAHTGCTETQFGIETVLDFLLIIPDCFQFANRRFICSKILQPFFIIFMDRHHSSRLSDIIRNLFYYTFDCFDLQVFSHRSGFPALCFFPSPSSPALENPADPVTQPGAF